MFAALVQLCDANQLHQRGMLSPQELLQRKRHIWAVCRRPNDMTHSEGNAFSTN